MGTFNLEIGNFYYDRTIAPMLEMCVRFVCECRVQFTSLLFFISANIFVSIEMSVLMWLETFENVTHLFSKFSPITSMIADFDLEVLVVVGAVAAGCFCTWLLFNSNKRCC